jgi:hypothetical protein
MAFLEDEEDEERLVEWLRKNLRLDLLANRNTVWDGEAHVQRTTVTVMIGLASAISDGAGFLPSEDVIARAEVTLDC